MPGPVNTCRQLRRSGRCAEGLLVVRGCLLRCPGDDELDGRECYHYLPQRGEEVEVPFLWVQATDSREAAAPPPVCRIRCGPLSALPPWPLRCRE